MKKPVRQQEVRQKICFPRQNRCCRGIGEKGRKKTCLQSWCQWWKCLWRKIRRFQVRTVLSILGTLLWSSLKYRKNTSIDEGILKQTMFDYQRVPKDRKPSTLLLVRAATVPGKTTAKSQFWRGSKQWRSISIYERGHHTFRTPNTCPKLKLVVVFGKWMVECWFISFLEMSNFLVYLEKNNKCILPKILVTSTMDKFRRVAHNPHRHVPLFKWVA